MSANPSEAATAYVVRDGVQVYALPPHTTLNIGRLETNDIVFEDHKVSREHAVLKYADGIFTLVDLASTHGTFVDGEGVLRQTIGLEAKIRIADHELVLTDRIPDALRAAPIIAPRVLRAFDRRIKFFGGLNEMAPLTLVQFLSQERQSGLLMLEIGTEPGPRLYFQDGEIIHVEGGSELARLMTRERHEPSLFFSFCRETHFPERTVRRSTAQFLMELCHQRDEQKLQEVDAAAAEKMARTQAPTVKLPGARPEQAVPAGLSSGC